jgi:hypothetical protein
VLGQKSLTLLQSDFRYIVQLSVFADKSIIISAVYTTLAAAAHQL